MKTVTFDHSISHVWRGRESGCWEGVPQSTRPRYIYDLRCSSVFDLGIRTQYGCPLIEDLVALMLGASECRISASSMDGRRKI